MEVVMVEVVGGGGWWLTMVMVAEVGKFVTSRNLRDRLYRELERNLAMKVEDGETADTFIVSGRGTLHITILIENMRREGYEFMVGPPKVINKKEGDKLLEPYESTSPEAIHSQPVTPPYWGIRAPPHHMLEPSQPHLLHLVFHRRRSHFLSNNLISNSISLSKSIHSL
ncbi:hypothetical protein FXO37_34764 [Capsicum annuum]|nr:hypothetical protein FXO37_34764 [Capsicum annuum]